MFVFMARDGRGSGPTEPIRHYGPRRWRFPPGDPEDESLNMEMTGVLVKLDPPEGTHSDLTMHRKVGGLSPLWWS
jgi:hypothetical protein